MSDEPELKQRVSSKKQYVRVPILEIQQTFQTINWQC